MAPRTRTLIIGLGEEGHRMAAYLAYQARRDPVCGPVFRNQTRTVSLVSSHFSARKTHEVDYLFSMPSSDCPAATQRTWQSLARVIKPLLDEGPLSSDAATSGNLFFDIWLVGSLADPLFRHHLTATASAITALMSTAFANLFRNGESGINRIASLIPAAVCPNPRTLTLAERNELVQVLQHMERLSLAPEHSAPWTPLIPRFLLMENTVDNALLSEESQRTGLQDLIWTSVVSGARHHTVFRNLVGFASLNTDFLSLITVSTLRFPIEYVRDYCTGHLLTEVCDTLLASGLAADAPLDAGTLNPLAESLDHMQKALLEERFLHADGQGDHVFNLCDTHLPRFDPWERSVVTPPPQPPVLLPGWITSINPLTKQKAYLPSLTGYEEPEVLAGFFDADWEQTPARVFEATANAVFIPFNRQRTRVLRELADNVSEKCIAPLLKRYENTLTRVPIIHLFSFWRQHIAATLERESRQARTAVHATLGRPWNLTGFKTAIEPLRQAITAQMTRSGVWLATFSLILCLIPVLQGILPNPKSWAVRLIPALNRFYSSTGLDPNERLTEGIPSVLLAVMAAFVVAVYLAWSKRSVHASHLRHLLHTLKTPGAHGDKPGPISQAIETERAAFHHHWRSRCLLAVCHEVSRTLASVSEPVAQHDAELESVVSRLSALRTRMQRQADNALEHYPPSAGLQSVWPPAHTVADLFAPHLNSGDAQDRAARFWMECHPLQDWNPDDAHLILKWATQQFPFLQEGMATLETTPTLQTEPLIQALRTFVETLPARLECGRYVRQRAYLDPDKHIELTDVVVIAPERLTPVVQGCLPGDLGIEVVASSGDPNRILGFRHIRDISVATFAAALDAPWTPLPWSQKLDESVAISSDDPYAPLRIHSSRGNERRAS